MDSMDKSESIESNIESGFDSWIRIRVLEIGFDSVGFVFDFLNLDLIRWIRIRFFKYGFDSLNSYSSIYI